MANGSYSVVFTIYDAPSGGTNLWMETQSVFTNGGLFNVNLGSLAPLGDVVFSGTTRYLGIKVGADPDGFKCFEPIGIDTLLMEAIKEQQKTNRGVESANFKAAERDTPSPSRRIVEDELTP